MLMVLFPILFVSFVLLSSWLVLTLQNKYDNKRLERYKIEYEMRIDPNYKRKRKLERILNGEK